MSGSWITDVSNKRIGVSVRDKIFRNFVLQVCSFCWLLVGFSFPQIVPIAQGKRSVMRARILASLTLVEGQIQCASVASVLAVTRTLVSGY